MPDLTTRVLQQLDQWRHLPAYQLERRADIFFAMWLPEVLGARIGCEIEPRLVPELPIEKALINVAARGQESVNVDYFALSADRSRGFLVELKTDMASRRETQDQAMRDASTAGWQAVAGGICRIIARSGDAPRDRKYRHLSALLAELGLLEVPPDIDAFAFAPRRQGLSARLEAIRPTAADPKLEVVYLQPRLRAEDDPHGAVVITFADFADHLEGISDEAAHTFAGFLRRWTEDAASRPPGG